MVVNKKKLILSSEKPVNLQYTQQHGGKMNLNCTLWMHVVVYILHLVLLLFVFCYTLVPRLQYIMAS